MKHSLRKILCLFLVMLIIPMFSLTVWAEDSDAELHSLHFDIALQEDGSALITETREILFNGKREFTRYGVDNVFTGPRVFSDWQVSIDGTALTQLDQPDNENRPENTFALEDNDKGNTVNIYFRQSDSGTRVFSISYRVENAVKLYSDVGEFFWNLSGEKGISDIGTLTATLTVPENAPTEDFLIWAHGPLNGTFEKQSDGSAVLKADNVPLGTIVDIRSALPAECFYGGWEQQGEALPEILAEEKKLADSANAKREEEERKNANREKWEAENPILAPIQRSCEMICNSISDFLIVEEYGGSVIITDECSYLVVAVLLVIPLLWITGVFRVIRNARYKRNMKKYRNSPAQSPQYYRDLPDDRPAPVIDKLVHFYDGNTSFSRQISAALLELNLKNLVNFSTATGDTVLLLNKQLSEELFSSHSSQRNPKPPHSKVRILRYQRILWDFLCNAAKESGQISIKNLKEYIKSNQADSFKFRNEFKSAVEKEFTERVGSKDAERYFHGKWKLHLIISGAAGILAMIIRIFSTLYNGIEFVESLKVGLIAFVAAAIIVALFRQGIKLMKSPCYILDQKGEDDLALWQAFGRYLNDFSTLDDKELPELSVWREYMVYAVALGNGKKVAEALAMKYPEALSAETPIYDIDYYTGLQDTDFYNAIDSIGREVADARTPSSSGDGDGGGFSDSGGGSDSGSGGDFID